VQSSLTRALHERLEKVVIIKGHKKSSICLPIHQKSVKKCILSCKRISVNFTVERSSGKAGNGTVSLSVDICGSSSCCCGCSEIGYIGLTRRSCKQVSALSKRREIVGVDVVLA